ncbi:hypothetical protein PybrP1_006553, partial [[Pythium] brassicae (nom. inval.)]
RKLRVLVPNETRFAYAGSKRGAARASLDAAADKQRRHHQQRLLLDPLTTFQREQRENERQAARLTQGLESQLDRLGGVRIPVAFLLERRHVAFAERVVLRAMCRAVARHLTRVARTAFASWKARTVGLRVLAHRTHHELLARQTTLARACAVVQRKLHGRMRVLLCRWRKRTKEFRAAARASAVVVLQRCWRRRRLLSRVTQLARVYRSHVRDVSAARIQCAAQRCVARRRCRLLVAERQRAVAARRIQHCYSSYQLRKLAFRQRRREAALRIQRRWRGACGRRHAQRRRAQIRRVAETVYAALWRRVAVESAVLAWCAARVLQRCVRAFLARCCVARAAQRGRRRRGCVPASRIQRAFRGFRSRVLAAAVAATIDALVVRFEDAASRIQRAFRRCRAATQQRAAAALTALFRAFAARKAAMRRLLAWFESWQAVYFMRWRRLYARSLPATAAGAHWQPRVAALDRRLQQLADDQRSARARLQTLVGCRVLVSAKRFHCALVDGSANAIRRRWRWHRLRALVRAQVQAAQQLRTLLPVAFCGFRRRQRRRRVLARWKRQRFAKLRRAFQQWRALRSLALEARALRVSSAALRRVRWFRHQKLRKRALSGWKAFVARRRDQANGLATADAWASRQLARRCWRVWSHEQLPRLTVQNRLRELVALLGAWQQLRALWQRRKQLQRATEWRAWRLKGVAIEGWKADWQGMSDDLASAQQHSERLAVKRSFSALRRYVAQLKRADELCGRARIRRGVRQWVFHWTRYVCHRREHQQTLARVAALRARTRAQSAVAQWRARVPILQDVRFTTRIADDLYHAKLKRFVFQSGFVRFWTLTVGARRVLMAMRIQRAVRRRRARQQLFVLRTKLRYQLAIRVAKALDVRAFSPTSLRDALQRQRRRPADGDDDSDDRRNIWVFVLLSYPWVPVAPAVRDAFSTVATNWRFLRGKRMAFGTISATEAASFPSGADAVSLLSWLGIAPHALPCVVAFWQGVSVAARSVVDTRGRALARRFECVCGNRAAEPALVLELGPAPAAGISVVQRVMDWIESLQRSSEAATATDLQAYTRGYRARCLAHQLRDDKRDAMAQRIQRWLVALRLKRHTRTRNRAALKLQRWYRGVLRRRLFWRDVRAAMATFRRAASALQRFLRRCFARKRLRFVCVCLLSTAERFPNAPVCDECFGAADKLRAESGAQEAAVDVTSSLVLAALKCRECRQALCTTCFATVHRSGKRLLHLADRIDAQAMNRPDTRVCDACEVAGCVKYCTTCSSKWRREDGDGTVGFCSSCFEAAHSEPSATRGKRQRPRAWWESQRFQSHEWTRAPPDAPAPAQATTAADVVLKYEWMTVTAFRRHEDALRLAERSQKARDDELFAVRMQHEAILRDAFDRYDRDRSGFIDRLELKRMFAEELCRPLRDDQIDDAMRAIDKSGDGRVEFDELLAWFAEGVLDQRAQVQSSASELLKDALRAKRAMRRYREKLAELLPPVASIKDTLSVLGSGGGAAGASKSDVPVPKVPGFPSVACLAPREFIAKRKVFFRFVKEICGLAWAEEDAGVIPVENARDVFERVFLPRWNAGQLTYDFYFDDEAFAFEGTEWRRQWDAQARKYLYHTRRRKASAPPGGGGEGGGGRKPKHRRKSDTKSRRQSGQQQADAAVDEFEDVVEQIDPRRKQLLYEAAKRAFASADQDASGFIDAAEFHRMLVTELCEPISRSKARAILREIDADGSGKIDFDEFFLWYATDKCQDYPTTPQMERVRGILKTRRRARATARAAVDTGVSGGRLVKQAIEEKLRANQLARDSKGASAELVALLYDGFPKLLACKALALHQQNLPAAREWLTGKREEAQREKAAQDAARDQRRDEQKRRAAAARALRKKRVAGVKRTVKLLLFGPNKKEVHATKVQNALQNLDREIQLVETQGEGLPVTREVLLHKANEAYHVLYRSTRSTGFLGEGDDLNNSFELLAMRYS